MSKEEIIADLGNEVYCDFCNDDYTESLETGGVLLGSYAVCPQCTKKLSPKERERADDCCPAWVPFAQWVMRLRNGDSTIKLITND